MNSDILVIQETHSEPSIEKVWQNEWGGKVLYSHGSTAARGIAVFMSGAIYENLQNVYRDSEGRIIIFDLQLEGLVTIAAIYAPNEDSPIFFREISKELRKRCEHKILVGDFNLVLDVEKDRKNTYCNNNKAKEEVENIMEEFSMKDIWRIRNPQKSEYSWIKKTVRSQERKASRIDLALISAGLDQHVEIVTYLSSICTDHRGIYIVVEMVKNQRGSGYWKMNTSNLQDLQFIKTMNKELEQTLGLCVGKSATVTWETLKIRAQKVSKEYARNKSSHDRIVISNLSEKVNEYEANLPLNEDEDKIYQDTKVDLEEKMLERIGGVMF